MTLACKKPVKITTISRDKFDEKDKLQDLKGGVPNPYWGGKKTGQEVFEEMTETIT